VKRLLLCLVLCGAGYAFAQHKTPAAGHNSEAAQEDHVAKEERDLNGWKWANFVVLVGLLGYLIAKNAPAFFQSRTSEIQKGIAEATALKQKAEAQSREIAQRLAGLDAEINKMRTEASHELHAEGARIHAETEQMLAKIHSQAEQDITSAGKAARQALKAHAAALAVELAEDKLRARLNAERQNTLVDGFVKDLRATRTEVN
jgi:F-type H+-transporting ATPase subunit b